MGVREFLRWLTGLSPESRALRAIADTPREITSPDEIAAITARLRA